MKGLITSICVSATVIVTLVLVGFAIGYLEDD